MKKSMLIAMIFCVILSLTLPLSATLSDYSFTATTGTYTEITGGTLLGSETSDDQRYVDPTIPLGGTTLTGPGLPIGFNFTFNDNVFDVIAVNNNGWISFGQTALGTSAVNNTSYSSYDPLSNTTAITPTQLANRVAGMARDIQAQTGASLRMETIGTAPNRVCVIQWKNYKRYGTTGTGDNYNFQIRLLENQSSISIIYGNVTNNATATTVQVGLRGSDATDFFNRTNTDTWTSTSAGATNAATCALSTTNYPPSGLIFTFAQPVAVPNDLQAVSITGSSTPSSGTSTPYTITVRNRGSNPQSSYTVKLMNGTTELASVAGPALTPGQITPIVLNWTPGATGPMVLTGKVVLAGDQNTANDVTGALNINVQPAGTNLTIIGDVESTLNQRQPFGIYWGYERDASLYTQTQIGLFGAITSVQWYCHTAAAAAVPYTIYLKTTTETALTAVPWATMIADAQNVGTGTMTFSQTGWVTFPLSVPYIYTGGNLVVMVECAYGGTGVSPYPYFRYTTGATGSHQYWYQDTTPPTGNGTLNALLPNIGLSISATTTTPQFSINPTSYNYGQLFMNTMTNKTFTITNTGGGTNSLGINSISISGSQYFTLQSLPTLPASLPSFQNTTFVVRYNPTTAGTHTATITIVDNLARTSHTVTVNATCVDPTIYTPPYAQNFDGVTVPNFPIEWTKLTQTTAGSITTSTTSPHSAANCVYMYNSSDATAGLYLLAPPVANSIPLVTMRVKFWAKASAGYTLGVGVIADPADAATYMEVTSQTLTAEWAEYVVGFQTYAGQGHYITFKHGLGGTYRAIYIDDVTIEVTPQNDLAALSITGNSTPTVGAPTNYTITVFNWGTNPQSNYQVKLYNQDNLELASVAGPQVQPGVSAQAVVAWTPSTAGAGTIYGKVILTGDQNSLNDRTADKTVNVQPAGTFMVTIGNAESTLNQRQPFGIYFGYERDASLYTQDQIGMFGLISGIQWYCHTSSTNAAPYKIYLKTINETALTAVPWATMIADAQLVAEGTYTFSETGWVMMPLSVPWVYSGGNLVVLVETNYLGSGTSPYPYFRYTAGAVGSHQIWYQDSSAPTDNGTLNANLPNIGLALSAADPNPHFNVNPTSFTYNQIFINTNQDKTFSIVNTGGGTNTLGITGITISGSPMFTLTNLPTLPINLASFASTTFTVRYAPTAAGTHTATITVTDNLGRSYNYNLGRAGRNDATRTQHIVSISGSCIDPIIYTPPYVQNFDTVTTPNLPIDWSKVATSPGTVTTVTTTPQSNPNCVYLYNSSSTDGPYLISPPIANNIPIVTMRVKFWAKGSTGYTLGVGVIADPTDTGTYEQTTSLSLTSSWAEYVVSFQTYNGAGHYIAFKHGNASTYQSIYIDNVTIEVTPQNDLAALLVTGNSTPTVGVATTYNVNVFNWGINPQSNYTVKLYNETNLELASTQGLLVNPGLAVDVPLSWTPTVAGDVPIYGKVVLNGDQNNLNDQTPNYTVSVQPAGTIVVTIGTATTTQRQPLGILYGYERDASLYSSDAVGIVGNVNGVRWYCGTTATGAVPYKIYAKNTDATALTAVPWATMITDAQLVKEGTYTFSQTGWVNFTFDTPYLYTGQGLIIMVETFYGSTGTTSPAFQYSTGPTASHQYWYQDNTAPTGNGYLNTQRPNIGLMMTAVGTTPAFAVSPVSYNYNQVFLNTTNNKTFNIINIGGGTNPLVVNSITISGSPMFSLQNLPTLPLSLNSFQIASFVVRYLPTSVGTHTATVTITDNLGRSIDYGVHKETRNNRDSNASRTAHPVQVDGTCIDPTIYTPPYVQHFDSVTAPALPIDWSGVYTSPGNVTTVTTSPNSPLNCVFLSNSTSTNGPYLVSPPIANNIPINTMRVKFWAKGAATYTLGVGIMSSPTDNSTYVQTQSVTLTSSWAEYVVGFQTYSGNGHYMAFKHGNVSTSQSIYIDDVTIEVTPQNDLAALSITGNPTPSVGMLANYTVNVFNWGTNPQTNYTVKLYNSDNVELASVAGTAVSPGLATPVVVPWTPTVAGAVTIYGKVILTGDQNNLNDQTPNLSLGVQPPGTVLTTIGTAVTTQRQPFGIYFGYERDATLISASDLNGTVAASLLGFQWYCSSVSASAAPYKIYIKPTTDTALAAVPWATMVDGATLLQEGTITFSQVGWTPFTFATPYLYTGGNFIVMVETFYGSTGVSPYPNFQYSTGPVGCHQYWYQDNTAPTGNGTLNTNRPNIGIFMVPGGVGHLTGHVYGAGNVPLADATVQIAGGNSAITDAQGHYTIQNIIANTYQVTAGCFGYIPQTVSVTIPEDITVTQNFTLGQMPTVSVSGMVAGSDQPTVGIAGAVINITGYFTYSTTTDNTGHFSIPGVYSSHSYSYTVTATGYQPRTGTINVGEAPLDMGIVIVNEFAYTPRNVTAVQSTDFTSVTVNWLAPDPNAVDITQSFENATFPPTEWTRVITNNNPAGTNGVYPSWCRFGTVVDITTTVTPPDGQWQCGFWNDYNHQDEWLITPQFNCPQSAHLTFGSYVFRGSTYGDHYYVKITVNNGANWTVLWDASTQTGGWNNYQTPITIDLSAYAGQQVKIAWHADDSNDEGMWYNWFIDGVVISNSIVTLRFNEDQLTTKSASVRDSQPQVVYTDTPMTRATDKLSLAYDKISASVSTDNRIRNHSRSLLGYKVWRLAQGQETNETNWVPLTPTLITDLTQIDTGWAAVAPGFYKWAVKAIYTGDLMSSGAFSQAIQKTQQAQGTLAGTVRNQNNLPVMGATITAGAFSTTTSANGSYSMPVNVGTYTVTCSATGYTTITQNNVTIIVNQSTTQNFTLNLTDVIDEVQVMATALTGNFPNPFNPETTISYDVKDATPVRIEIYNTKGQLIRTLVNEYKAKGHYQTKWNGKDNNGSSVASGVYHYRMRAGNYKADRMMMLMK